MKYAAIGALLGGVLVGGMFAAGGTQPTALAQRATSYPAGGQSQLMALSTPVSQKYQQVTVIDPLGRVMSVYHIELASGQIELKSVRNITWDLQMIEFDTAKPAPQEVRSMVEPRL